MSLSKEILEGSYKGVERLLSQGADINVIDEYGFTPLIHATVTNRKDIVSLLLNKNANVHMVDFTGTNALQWAIDNNNIELTQLLLNHGANPNTYSSNGQPALFYPILRKNQTLIKMLIDKGAKMDFAKDFIQAKLIGHRFELQGESDIVTSEGLFIAIDLEGFYLEFTLGLIKESLERFMQSYVAHRMNIHSNELKIIIKSFENASQLREFKHFSKNVDQNMQTIKQLMDIDLLLLPVSYKGHAINFIKHGDFLAKCDRGVNKMTDPIVINTVGRPSLLNTQFYKKLLYEKHTERYMKHDIYQILNLRTYAKLPIKHQITGNCSWANTESSVPTMLYMLLHDKIKDPRKVNALVGDIMAFYYAWLEWDKDRALEDWLLDFDKISFLRQKSKATLIGAVLFQACHPSKPRDIERAKKILAILSRKEFQYIVRSYANIFVRANKSSQGQSFHQMIEQCGYKLSQFSN
ncbi:MAG: Dot/Icm T4SS effector AnkH/LegA3 [Candidatus Berkiella sp.]